MDVIKTLTAFMDFCYIARLDTISETSLDALDDSLRKFHHHRKIFQESGVRPTGFSLPRQHALTHYRYHIEKFGAPNRLSSSITESKHITAVKQPWRQSNHYNALGQMLTTNSRNDKLAAARVDFSTRGMLNGTCLGEALERFCDPPEDTTDDDSDGDGDGDNGQDLDADEDEEVTGPVDGPSALSEVTLALKRGKDYFFQCATTSDVLLQLVDILLLHSRNLAGISSKRTLHLSSGFSCFINRTLPPPRPLQSPPVRPSSMPTKYLSFIPPRPSFAPQVIIQASRGCIVKLSDPPRGGKQAV